MRTLDKFNIIIGFVFGLWSHAQELPPEPAVDSDKNWTSSIGYDLLGNTLSKGVSYFNDLGKSTQSQSWDLLTNKVWASQVLYDAQGRPVFSTLSAPIGTGFGLNDTDFLLDFSNSAYTLNDFDVGGMVDNPSMVSASSKLGAYYNDNPDDTFQDNTWYPFSRVVYSDLNPGAVKKTLGGNKANGQWLQSYSFSMPAAQELSNSRAFGNSAYNDDRITKTVSRDVNGVETVVFIDGDGNTLAAARSGNEEDPSLGQYYMTSTINEQGFVDIHIPVGCSGVTLLNNPTGSSLKVYDLVTEDRVYTSLSSLPSGIYRFAVNNPDTFVYEENNQVRLRYYVNYYDYALNTYDKAGRLLKSTQPLGDELESTYTYNSLGQLLETTSPDEGTARFKYRKDGQIRFSQNSKQALLGEVSFTDYDELGRPIRSGVGTADFDTLDPDTSTLSSQLKELHETLYDEPDPKLIEALLSCNIDDKLYRQTFLYGNVSMSVADKPFTSQTWYSYDVYGRVKWLVQLVAELDCVKTINYSYDPLTGQVTKVDYQRHVPSERFIHQYDYNVAGQLTMVSTSRDDVDYTENAKYFYTETGALRRTEIAENLQGIDYVYNVNGQLKAINSPLSEGFKDPGNDSPGTNGFMTDVFGMILDYHNQDYTRTGDHLGGLKNTGVNSQFNGNIGGARWNNDTPTAMTVDTYAYSYNKNNWLTQASFGTSSSQETTLNGHPTGLFTTNFIEDANGDYKVDNITYDANGNIKTLTRNGVTNASGSNDMDEFTYHYKDGKNQLSAVEDTGDNTDPMRYNDLRNQYITTTVTDPFGNDIDLQTQENYIYNSIGQLETNVQDGISYEYNASGLVTKINGFTDSNTGNWSTIYSEDYTTVTLNEQSFWTAEGGNATINFNNYTSNVSTVNCDALQDTYGNSFGIIKTQATTPQTPGQMSGQRNFTVLEGKLHQLSLDVIAKQIEHVRLQRFDPDNPPPIVILEDNPTGYKIEVLDANDQVLTATSYNTPNPVMIDDPNLNDIEPCSKYYTNGHSLQFTPNTDKVSLKVTVYYNANVSGAAFYMDNITLDVAEAPKVAFYYNDRGHRVRKESYDDNGNTFRTVYVRDAAGSPMAIYEEATGPTVQQAETLKELPVYGASRLGIYYRDNSKEGTYAYQLSDHLGNVRAVVIKSGTNALSLTNKTDYYPFGSPMPDRNVEGNYRYGYQGEYAEKDPETGMEVFELRQWDSRIGRWLTIDPMDEFYSPYLGMGNNPIRLTDPDGGSTEDNIYFNDDGTVARVETNDDPNRFFDSEGKEMFFNAADELDENMLTREFKVGEQVYFQVSKNETISMLSSAGFEPLQYKAKAAIARKNGNNDLAVGYEVLALKSAADNSFGGKPADFTKSQLMTRYNIHGRSSIHDPYNETAAYFRFGNANTIYNWFDAGNHLWGSWMQANGFSMDQVIFGSQFFAIYQMGHWLGDTKADQSAIINGYLHKGF